MTHPEPVDFVVGLERYLTSCSSVTSAVTTYMYKVHVVPRAPVLTRDAISGVASTATQSPPYSSCRRTHDCVLFGSSFRPSGLMSMKL